MNNPFKSIEARLASIENLILDLKHQPQQVEPSKTPDRLLTIQEAAQFLNLTVPTIYSKVSRNELPVMKKGKRLYFSKVELLDYLKPGKRKTQFEIESEANNYINKKRG